MAREYVVLDNGVIYYDEDGRRISFLPDPANSEYQRYLRWLNGEDEASGTLS